MSRTSTILAVVCSAVAAAGLSAADPDVVRLFRDRVEPVLRRECYRCHSASVENPQAGLSLDTAPGLSRGGDSGPAIVPGNSRGSLLMQALRHENGLAMPPKKPRLADAVLADIARWIDAGAPDPRSSNDPLAEARRHWSFQPVRRPTPPRVTRADWVRTPVDAFVLAQLESRGWSPAAPASRAEFIRRATFDLHGLPPTPEEVAAYVNDVSPNADERLVDRLLASERYGERAAQHWLDVVRYAESEGYEYDRHLPDAWRYRDYVIQSFNADKPFDQFVVEQLAGDELDAQNPEYLTASIFHRLGPVRRNAGNPEIALSRNEVLTERTDIIGQAFLGLTIGCARCHNHKLEPISQKDYYCLQAYLAATDEHNVSLADPETKRAWEQASERVQKELARLKSLAKDATGREKERLTEQIEALEEQMPAPLPTIPAIHNDFPRQTAIHVLTRGVWELKGERVGPRPLSVLLDHDVSELPPETTNPRTHLARWIAAPDHPLTARVLVNRLWQQLLGTGLVQTANDFGLNGERPSHPELLDWLAAELVEGRELSVESQNHSGGSSLSLSPQPSAHSHSDPQPSGGWSIKRVVRTIVLSSTYRQSSRSAHQDEYSEHDPENRWLWRQNRRRLTAEEVRDAMLAVSGRLNLKMGGPSVIVPVDPELVALLYKPSQWSVTPDPREHDRRSIYLIAKRNLRLPFFETLDAPALQTSCARRETSTHAPQALELLNGALSNDLARSLAERLQSECGPDFDRIVERAFRLALGRAPTAVERDRSASFLRDQPLSEFALALFNLHEFLYVP